MKNILMILTSHRLDCLKLCIDLLIQGGSANRFDRICLLCSGITGRHRRFVRSLPNRHPDISWDFIWGARGRGKPISDMQNECVRRYAHNLYFKIDEDTFVSSDWDLALQDAYEHYKDHPDLSLLTPVVTNNQRGAYHLLTTFPELGEEFVRRFNKPIVTDRMGPVWLYPQCAEFLVRRFLNLEQANRELRAQDDTTRTFSYPFSINCICYDHRHWEEIGGVPEEDENGWGKWIPEQNKFIVLACRAVVHHYAFFVQQNWLDRTTLLEDIRNANCFPPVSGCRKRWRQIRRILPQIPAALLRKYSP